MPAVPQLPEIRLLGVPSVQVEGRAVSAFRSNRIPALLGLLSTKTGPWPREAVAATLWPDSSAVEGRHNLRQTVLYTRNLLGEEAIVGDRQTLELGPEVETDVQILLRTGDSRQSPEMSLTTAEQAIAAYRGEFLEGLEDEWIPAVREQCARIYVTALMLLSESLLELEPVRALELADLAVQVEPFLDSARARKIQALRSLGEDAAAHREFGNYRQLLAEELGIEPSNLVTDILNVPRSKNRQKARESEADEPIKFLLSGNRPRQGLELATARVPFWIAKGQYDEGASLLRQALEANARHPDFPTFQRARVALAELLSAAGRQSEAAQTLSADLPELEDPLARARSLILQARIAMSAYRPNDGANFARQALEIAESHNLAEERMDGYRCAAEIAFQMEDLQEAEERAQACVQMARSLDDWDTFARAVSLLAITQHRSGRHLQARYSTTQALNELSDKDSSRGATFTRVRIYRLLEEMGEREQAEAGYRRGVVEARRLNDVFGLGIALTYLGDLLTSKGAYEEALEYHLEAHALRRKAEDRLGEATSLRGIGRAYLALGKLEEAGTALRESVRLFDSAGQASVLYELARVCQQAGEREMALRLARQAAHLLRGMSRLTLLTIGPSGDSLVAEAEELVKILQ